MNTRILICCHKRDLMTSISPYFPIHVGKELSKENLGITGDNTGDNISYKNDTYCELTGIYWAWKNLKNVDIIGLCHYRRYFDFHNQCNVVFPYTIFHPSQYTDVNLTIPDKILNKVYHGTIVVAKSINTKFSLYHDYCISHISEDFRILENIFINELESKYKDAFNIVMHKNNKLNPCNMFIMNWTEFDSYCNWLFSVLDKVEQKANISNYNSYQKRIYGFMAERLLNVYIKANKLETISKRVILFTDQPSRKNIKSVFSHIFINWISNIFIFFWGKVYKLRS